MAVRRHFRLHLGLVPRKKLVRSSVLVLPAVLTVYVLLHLAGSLARANMQEMARVRRS